MSLDPARSPLRLRAQGAPQPFHVILVEPEIPPNTGNIARICAATGARLHLVHPLGFRTDAKAVRRAGLDYWHLVDLEEHSDFSSAIQKIDSTGASSGRQFLLSARAPRSYLEVAFQPGDAIVFGCESSGLPAFLLEDNASNVIGIPMPGAVRSLNLANSVGIVLYEALRQTGALKQAAPR